MPAQHFCHPMSVWVPRFASFPSLIKNKSPKFHPPQYCTAAVIGVFHCHCGSSPWKLHMNKTFIILQQMRTRSLKLWSQSSLGRKSTSQEISESRKVIIQSSSLLSVLEVMHRKDQITEELTFALGEMKISVFIEEKLTSKQHLLWWIFFPLFRAQSWLSRTPTPGLSCNRSADLPEGQWKYYSVLLEHHLLRNTLPWVQCHRVSQWHQAPNQLSHFPNESPPEYFKYKEPETVYLLCFFCHPLPLLGGHASHVSSKISGFKAEEPGRDCQSSTLLDESMCIWNIFSVWLQVYLLIHSSAIM